jgi:hypothetical protein
MIFIAFTQARSRARGRKPEIGLFTELSQENGEKLLGSFPLVWDSIRVVNKRQAVVSQREEITQPPERHQDALRGIHCRIPSRSLNSHFDSAFRKCACKNLESYINAIHVRISGPRHCHTIIYVNSKMLHSQFSPSSQCDEQTTTSSMSSETSGFLLLLTLH